MIAVFSVLETQNWSDSLLSTLQVDEDDSDEAAASAEACFKLHGRNIVLSDDGKAAERTASYDHGIVISRSPLRPGRIFRVSELFTVQLDSSS